LSIDSAFVGFQRCGIANVSKMCVLAVNDDIFWVENVIVYHQSSSFRSFVIALGSLVSC